jgi:hypothetical protein
MNKKNYITPERKEIAPENIPNPKIVAAIQMIQLAANAAHKNRDVRHFR